MSRTDKSTSKFLSLILRHHPERIGLALDRNGWADLDELIAAAKPRDVTSRVNPSFESLPATTNSVFR